MRNDRDENHKEFYLVVIVYCCLLQKYCAHGLINAFQGVDVGNRSKHGKCGSAPTRKSQWGARLAGRTHVHG